MCVRSDICTTLLKQNVAGMQVFSATVGRLGQTGSQMGQNWIKHESNVGHVGHPGHVYRSVGHVGPGGYVGHWASEFM